MSTTGHHTIIKFLAVLFIASLAGGPECSAQDAGAPPWGEWLRQFKRDRLLRKPFHMMPETEVKGLASKIRARELDVPNRKKGIRYLKELDCTQFPEAKEMLLSLLDPKAEKFEEVRFEAAMGLRDMLARHSCNPNAKGAKGGKNGKNGGEDGQSCHCRSCCDAKTLNTLAKTAYEMNEDGCCYEPSLRVREMAVEAIKSCGVPCNFKPYYGEFDEEPGPPVSEESNRSEEVVPGTPNEGSPEPSPSDNPEGAPAPLPAVTDVATPITRLENLCIVSFAHGRQVPPDLKISTVYRGRIYYFASEEAKEEFVSDPQQFAVAFGGCDPVHFVETKQPVEGRFLASHEGHFYMFSTRENHQAFKSNPSRYALKATETGRIASAE